MHCSIMRWSKKQQVLLAFLLGVMVMLLAWRISTQRETSHRIIKGDVAAYLMTKGQLVVPTESSFEVKTSDYRMFTLTATDLPMDQSGSVVIMTISNDTKSFGCVQQHPSIALNRYLEMIGVLDYPRNLTSIAMLTHDEDVYLVWRKVFKERFSELQYQSIKVVYRPSSFVLGANDRHADNVQTTRRREIARQRNFLLTRALEDHEHVLWIDADMVRIPKQVLSKMVSSGKDIIATQTLDGPIFYDKNTWVGPRTKPSAVQLEMIERGERTDFVPFPDQGSKFLDDFQDSGEEFVRLDSVGGTLLYVKAKVHRDGAIFPTQLLIGASWKSEGYDGIETEGLCHLAERLGYLCWGMPKEKARHIIC
eukprot:TRINITY_DN11713_c0_g2_i1.p1 TRINITY_DN11713_c0_g2~~TRINITY_DN11713_c0_g2_i1.p1  ORF type:complete len:365 (-),score=85.50 TRINITY_DN11713_c0_g2_i1:480-1574(-)